MGKQGPVPSFGRAKVGVGGVAEGLQRVLLRSIETGGSSISDYVAPDGSDGAYQNERRVYAREGEACATSSSALRSSDLGSSSAAMR